MLSYMCVYICMYVRRCVFMYVRMYVYKCVCMYVYKCVCMYVCVCVCVCIPFLTVGNGSENHSRYLNFEMVEHDMT